MLRMAFILAVINTFYRLTVNANRPAWVFQGTGIRISPFFGKAFAASSIHILCMLSSNHYIAFAAALALVVNTIIYCTV